jgi:Ala-tRNA(Pro) deacylase
VDLRLVAERIGDGKLSFGSPERLMKHLGLTPGSVSPFGLLNDPGRQVRVFLDGALEGADRLTFHPNDNTATLVLSGEDFRRFLGHVGHAVRWIAV